MSGPGTVTVGSAEGRWILTAAILGSGLAGIDATVVNVALPSMGADLGADFAALQWTVTAYTLTLAAFILTGGALGDRYGRRRIFLVGVIWFAAASLLCGLAPTAPWLIAARALQGVGAALLVPGSLAMIQSSFSPQDRGRAIGAWSGLGGVATAIGPFLGGWLVEAVSWRWVFLINVPLAVVVVVLSRRHVPETRDPAAVGSVDLPGSALAALALGGVTYALIHAGESGWGSAVVLVAGAMGVLAGAAFLAVEARLAHPMLPLSIFSSRQFSAANAVTFTIYGAFSAVFFLLVIHLQVVAGFGAIAAGAAMLPVTGLMLVLSAPSGELASRIGPRLQMSTGPLVCAAGLLLMLRIGPGAGYLTDVLPGVLVFGLGLSILVAPLTATALAAADPEHAGLASGVNNAVARSAGLIAIAVLPAIAGLGGEDYQDPAAFDEGFQVTLLVSAAVLTVGAVLAALTISNRVLAEEKPTPAPAAASTPVRHCSVGGPPQVVARPGLDQSEPPRRRR